MSEFKRKLNSLTLPSWMDKGEPAKLLAACQKFWKIVYGWLTWPLMQLDAQTCVEPLLNLLAYQRDIHRFNGEPLELYRQRVKYAFINAKDAGSVSGFIAIFKRLGIGYVEINERQPGIDWDVIILRVTDKQLASHPDLLINIIRQYGRTCRRYRFEVLTVESFAMRVGLVEADYICYHASLPNQSLFIRIAQLCATNQSFGASLL